MNVENNLFKLISLTNEGSILRIREPSKTIFYIEELIPSWKNTRIIDQKVKIISTFILICMILNNKFHIYC